LTLGDAVGPLLGDELGLPVGTELRQVSCCVIVAIWTSARVCVRTLPTREEPVIITTGPAPKIMPCIKAFAPM
jgi:hypothetical protein